MNKKNLEQTELSYYGLYLLNYLKENKFEQSSDAAFVKAPDGAQEIAMSALVHGLHYSRYAILREVVESEFHEEIPEDAREGFVEKLLPLVGNVFSIYDLSDDQFALSSDYDLLYTELTGAVVLYLREYGI